MCSSLFSYRSPLISSLRLATSAVKDSTWRVRARRRWPIFDTEPAHWTLKAKESWTASSSDRLERTLLSLGVRRFLATTVAVMSFFITESPTVRGPVGDTKDGRHMLSWEGKSASSPTFKSRRRSDGQAICEKWWRKERSGKLNSQKKKKGILYRQQLS